MNDIDPIEQRLRRTFQAVAEQPVAPLGDPEPWRHDGAGPRRRRGRVMAAGLAVVVVVALIVLGVTYGPRSSRLTPTTQPLSGTPAGTLNAVFTPATPVSSAILEEAAATMAARLHAVGDTDARATVDGGSIDIASPKFAGVQMQLIGSMGSFSVRPVLCGAPAQTPTQPATSDTTGTTEPATSSPACEAQYETTASNLNVNTTTGQPATIGPDPVFAPTPSTPTQDDQPAAAVLLPADPVAGAQQYPRFVLGAAQLGNSDIGSAQARFDQAIDGWLIDVTLTPSGTTAWNAMALQNFHQYVAFDLDGQVLSAPLIEPNQTTFASFGGEMEISGTFTATTAKTIAAVLGNGPLPVPFTLLSQTTTP